MYNHFRQVEAENKYVYYDALVKGMTARLMSIAGAGQTGSRVRKGEGQSVARQCVILITVVSPESMSITFFLHLLDLTLALGPSISAKRSFNGTI